ncbi:MAG: type 4a pilus biogenesis protein PilO [Candidatus Omnitrophota bacterium]|nr:type 4a pilus biogenesis protein PilO [Candidatus Omnitrophota bacterium]
MINKFLSKLAPRERTILIGTVLVISVMFLDRMILGPIFSRIRVLGEKIQEKEGEINTGIRILANDERVKQELGIYGKYSLKALPSEDELADLLGEIENLAQGAQVYLIDSSPAGTRNEGMFKKYIVKIDCEGHMEEIVEFMHSIESSRKLINIESLRIRPKEKGSDMMNCNLSIAKTVVLE